MPPHPPPPLPPLRSWKPHAHAHTAQITQLQFSPNSSNLLSVSYDGTARLLDVEKGAFTSVFQSYSDDAADKYKGDPGYGAIADDAWLQYGVLEGESSLYMSTSKVRGGGVRAKQPHHAAEHVRAKQPHRLARSRRRRAPSSRSLRSRPIQPHRSPAPAAKDHFLPARARARFARTTSPPLPARAHRATC
jgi:hypothetical protein